MILKKKIIKLYFFRFKLQLIEYLFDEINENYYLSSRKIFEFF